MSKRKGLSLEDKRQRMLEIFYEKREVFQLKELEKIGPAEKGIVSQSVKDVVTSLVDDGYADSEKIGTSIYFWAFPSKATAVRKRKLDQLEVKLEEAKNKKEEVGQNLKKARLSREDVPDRAELLQKLKDLRGEKENLLAELEKYRDSDPDVIAQEKKDILVAKDGAYRWTDNVLSIRSWIRNKFGMEEEAINKQFGIPEDFEETLDNMKF